MYLPLRFERISQIEKLKWKFYEKYIHHKYMKILFIHLLMNELFIISINIKNKLLKKLAFKNLM